jgi:Rad3-related DNA helicase
MESPFDVEKAPIYVYPQPIMKYGPDIDDRRAQMGSSIAAVLREHPDEKGLILCNSYKEVDVYDEYLRTKHPEQWNRVIRQEKGDNIEDLMEQHIGHENSIIMSPSLWEGLDLRGELGTFLIVAKIPYPEYTNPIVQGLKNLDNNRYFEDTVLKIRQGVGRVIRSREDHAKIYILDGAFKTIYRYNRKQFPQEFIDRVIYVR